MYVVEDASESLKTSSGVLLVTTPNPNGNSIVYNYYEICISY